MACHQADYASVRLPNHSAGGFPQSCQQCHNTARWSGALFDHPAQANGFALIGAHIRTTCSGCHTEAGGLRFGKPATVNDCVMCHRSDYDRKHSGTNMPLTCLMCHNAERWDDVTFAHDRFPLSGAHALPCGSCHATNNALIFPRPANASDCYACHRADYERRHAGSGYPVTCTACHRATSWRDAQFNHDQAFFPINSGKHAGKWSSCAQCHPSAGTFAVFSCTGCHTQAVTDPKHRQVNGYSFDSLRCLACHPRGD